MPLFMPLRSDGLLGRPSASSASNHLSSPSSATFANSGDTTPPCGVPVSVGEQKPTSTTPALSHWRRVVVHTGQFGQQWCMVNVIKAAAHIRVEHPWTTMLTIHRRLDGLNRSHRAAPWPKARGVGFNARLPCWLQGRLDDCLHHPVLSGRYAQGSLFPVVFRDIHPSDRAGLVPLEAQAFLKQPPAGFRSGVHPPIHPCRVFALVFLGDTSDRQELVGRGSNQSTSGGFSPSSMPCSWWRDRYALAVVVHALPPCAT